MCTASPAGCELRASVFAPACRWRLDTYRCGRSITGREPGAIGGGSNLQRLWVVGVVVVVVGRGGLGRVLLVERVIRDTHTHAHTQYTHTNAINSQ